MSDKIPNSGQQPHIGHPLAAPIPEGFEGRIATLRLIEAGGVPHVIDDRGYLIPISSIHKMAVFARAGFYAAAMTVIIKDPGSTDA